VTTDKILFKTGNFYELFQYKMPIEIGTKKSRIHEENISYSTQVEIDQESARVSASRARSKLRRLILGNMWHDTRHSLKFITLTFANEVTNLDYANYQLQKFRQSISRHIKEKINYIAVPEIQPKRQQSTGKAVWHYHLLTFNLPYIHKTELTRLWGHGFTDPTKVNRVENTTLYLSKYLAKAYGDQRLKNRKRYYNALHCQTVKYKENTMVNQQLELLLPNANLVTEYPLFRLDQAGTKQEVGTKSEYFLTL
jgi:hypothetical protein